MTEGVYSIWHSTWHMACAQSVLDITPSIIFFTVPLSLVPRLCMQKEREAKMLAFLHPAHCQRVG